MAGTGMGVGTTALRALRRGLWHHAECIDGFGEVAVSIIPHLRVRECVMSLHQQV